MLGYHEISSKSFCQAKMKKVKTAIFRDFRSLLLASSKIFPHPYKWEKNIVSNFAQKITVPWPKILGRLAKKQIG